MASVLKQLRTSNVLTRARQFSSGRLNDSDAAGFGSARICRGVGRATNVVMKSASGCWVTDIDDKKYLDFTSGIGVVSTGHCHPRVVEATQKQCATLTHGQFNIGFHEPMLRLIDEMIDIMPHESLDTFFFANSGAEAVENAIKLARHATGKPNVITMQGGFHGRTIGTMSITTSKAVFRSQFGPLMPGVFVAPFPYKSVFPDILTDQEMAHYCLQQIEQLLIQQSTPSETAALVIEPVQGEGGYIVPPDGYLRGVQEICNKNDILFVVDEVQTGFGRTGKMFAIEHFGDIVPDVLVVAKGMASGYPLSGVVSRKELMDSQTPGSMGGTYAGNAVACAAAHATLQVFKEENVLQNSVERGGQMKQTLEALATNPDHNIKDVRGLGMMVAMEFDRSICPKGVSTALVNECFKHGLLLLTTGPFETVRFIPPLIISESELQQGLDIFVNAVHTVFGTKKSSSSTSHEQHIDIM